MIEYKNKEAIEVLWMIDNKNLSWVLDIKEKNITNFNNICLN